MPTSICGFPFTDYVSLVFFYLDLALKAKSKKIWFERKVMITYFYCINETSRERKKYLYIFEKYEP